MSELLRKDLLKRIVKEPLLCNCGVSGKEREVRGKLEEIGMYINDHQRSHELVMI